MATILGGDVTVTYLDNNRQKRISWSGDATTTYTANQLYSALMDLMDESTEMDDGIPMSAETPVEYTLGKIDAGDLDPWYITYETMQHITGGAIKTAGWTHANGSAVGIVIAPVATGSTIVAADLGYTMTHTNGDTGTLLDILVPVSGGTEYLVIRPDTNDETDSFPDTSGTITSGRGAFTGTQNAAATTGEQIWANFYSVTPIEADTHVYLYQGTVADATRARIASILDETQDWWGEGAFDRCVFIRDYKLAGATIIDSGYVTALVRKGNTLYDSFELQASNTSGGRNPIPLSASTDLNQTTGYKSITYTNASTTAGHWNVGDEILGGTSGARGIITQIVNPETATQTVHYYLIGDPQTDFNTAAETANNQDAGGTGSKDGNATADQGPALSTWFTNNTPPTVSHASTPTDIDDDGTSEGYGIVIDCNQNPLTEVYEWLKYITRNGETSTTNTDGVEGEQYEGATVYLEYSGTVSGGTIAEGDDVLQATTLAKGVVISHDTSNKQILLRNTRGTFNTTNTITSQDAGAGTVTANIAATTFAPNKQAPFGSFAGGRFFGARGVVLTDYVTATDENSFQLTDSSGTARQRPQAYTITVTNLVGGAETLTTSDKVAAFRLTGSGGSINKTEYSAAGGETAGGATLAIDSPATITTDTPGKTAGGVLRLRDASNNNQEYRIRYSSWATSTFTLANFASFVTTATTNTTQVTYATGGFNANVKRGDLVYNSTRTAVSYVKTVDSDTQLTIFPAIAGQTNADSVEINCIPIALVDTADNVFVSLIDQHATTTTASTSIVTGGATINYRVVVRNVGAATKIKPFTTDDAISTANRSVATIRTEDTIYT
jgi:hypothetical protein